MKYNKENIKQIVLIITAFLLIFIGYFNYSFDSELLENHFFEKNDLAKGEERNELTLGDVQLVNAEISTSEKVAIVPNEALEENESIKKENVAETLEIQKKENTNKDNYYEETRLERNRMYSEMLETYQNLIDLPETPQDQKAIAANEISNINKIKNGVMIAENLIKNKGFEDVVIFVNGNNVSVVVKSYILNQEQISKIQNIVQRELNVEIKDINISNKY